MPFEKVSRRANGEIMKVMVIRMELVLAGLFFAFPILHAGTYQVTNDNASGPGSLADAIVAANAGTEAFTITFDAGVTRIALEQQLTIALNAANEEGLVIEGAGVELDLGQHDRAFYIDGGQIAIHGLALMNTAVSGGSGGQGAGGGGGGAGLGGAIFLNQGDLTLVARVEMVLPTMKSRQGEVVADWVAGTTRRRRMINQAGKSIRSPRESPQVGTVADLEP